MRYFSAETVRSVAILFVIAGVGLWLTASSVWAAIIAEYDSGAGVALSPTTQGWLTNEIVEEGDPSPVLASAITTNPEANAGAGGTGWIVRDYIDGISTADRPEYFFELSSSDFDLMKNNGWTYTASFRLDSVDYNQVMRVLSIDQGGDSGEGAFAPFDLKLQANYEGGVETGDLRLGIIDNGTFNTGVPANQFNTIVVQDSDGNGTFTVSINGTLLDGGTEFVGGIPGVHVAQENALVLGANSSGGDGGGIEYDFARLEVGDAPLVPTLTIDRGSGNLTLANSASPRQIVGYSITSSSGALNPGNSTWTSITENYDLNGGTSPGNGTVDPNNEWVELTSSTSRTDLSEFEPDGSGAAFASAQPIDLGNAWIKNPNEDLVAELLLFDGSTEELAIIFTGGPTNAAFEFGDLDFDGDLDVADFTGEFKPGFGAHTVGLSPAEQYQAGDLNADGIVDEFDFLLLNDAYLVANPLAAPLSFTVPETATIQLLLIGALICRLRRISSRMKVAYTLAPILAVFAFASLSGQSSAADLLAHWKFDEAGGATIAIDSTGGGHNGTASGSVTAGTTGIIGNAWEFTGGYVPVTTAGGADSLLNLGDTFSISGWIITSQASNGSMFSISDNTQGSEEVLFRAAGTEGPVFGHADLVGRPGIDAGQAVTTTRTNDGEWHLLTFAQDFSGWGLYVDGILEDSGVSADGLASAAGIGANVVNIGANDDSGGGVQWLMNGQIDDLAVWDERLTDAEVQKLLLAGQNGIDAGTPFDATLSLEVAENTGQVFLNNNSGIDFEIDLYRVRSPGDSLSPNTWNSLDVLGFDSDAWSILATETDKVSEGAFGDSTIFVDGLSPVNLGDLYNENVNAKDLIFEYHIAGTAPQLLYEGDVSYVMAAADADFDDDGDVDGVDFLIWQSAFGKFPGNASNSDGDANNDGFVTTADLDIWENDYGSESLQAAVATVPEPGTICLVFAAVAFASILARDHRNRTAAVNCLIAFTAVLCVMFADTQVQADVTNDREYQFGDQSGEGALDGMTLGFASSNGATWDSAGSTSIEFQDLIVVDSPKYVEVASGDPNNDRPGAPSGALGASFDGVDDYVLTPINFAVPSSVWDNPNYYPLNDFPNDYDGINSQGMQLWVKPNGLTQNARQDIIKNSGEHGISITENNTWGVVSDIPEPLDSGVPVQYDQWTHVMQISGITDLSSGSSISGGALFVNGVIVEAKLGAYEFHENQPLTIGAMQFEGDLGGATPSAPEYFYHGLVDDAKLFLWGENQSGSDNYGAFNAGTDNDWIAMQLSGFEEGDVNLDGMVSGNGTLPANVDDVTALIENWLTVQIIPVTSFAGGLQMGDWNSRQNGDLNFDGIVDLKDAFILRDGLIASGLGALDFSLLSVPEPSTIAMVLVCLGILGQRRRIIEMRI